MNLSDVSQKSPLVSVRGVCKTYDKGAAASLVVLEDVDLSLYSGKLSVYSDDQVQVNPPCYAPLQGCCSLRWVKLPTVMADRMGWRWCFRVLRCFRG